MCLDSIYGWSIFSFMLPFMEPMLLPRRCQAKIYSGTNTYLISPPHSTTRLLLDTGQGSAFPVWRRSLKEALNSESARLGKQVRITQCVLTHWHHDHVGGVSELRELCAEYQVPEAPDGDALRIYKYPLFDSSPPASELPQDLQPGAQTRERETQLLRSANDDQDIGPIHPLQDGQILEVGDIDSSDEEKLRIQVLHTPGHTFDHIALLISSSPADPGEVGTIFTGDAVLGHGTAVFEDLGSYMASLEKMKEAIDEMGMNNSNAGGGHVQLDRRRKVTAFPAHGAVIPDARGKIEEYIAHRAMREREVLDVLARGSSQDEAQDRGAESISPGWTPMEIVKVVYKDIPKSLHIAAQGGVVQVLGKLEGEGRVEKLEDGNRWRVARSQDQGVANEDIGVGERKAAL
jgi:endoribonuclease LACTB2